jgi:hypothetical protein
MNPTSATDQAIQELNDLKALLKDRKSGLVEQDAGPSDQPEQSDTVDNDSARLMRQQFATDVVPLIEAVPSRPPYGPDEWTYRGYMIGIDDFRDVYVAFRDCEAVQICFALNKPLADGGQLQMVFRGAGGNSADLDKLFATGQWEGGGTSPDSLPKPCMPSKC